MFKGSQVLKQRNISSMINDGAFIFMGKNHRYLTKLNFGAFNTPIPIFSSSAFDWLQPIISLLCRQQTLLSDVVWWLIAKAWHIGRCLWARFSIIFEDSLLSFHGSCPRHFYNTIDTSHNHLAETDICERQCFLTNLVIQAWHKGLSHRLLLKYTCKDTIQIQKAL